jgi:hypothetical protein
MVKMPQYYFNSVKQVQFGSTISHGRMLVQTIHGKTPQAEVEEASIPQNAVTRLTQQNELLQIEGDKNVSTFYAEF